MYRYDEFDARLVAERVAQFRGQVARRLAGELSEDAFKPLRLQNGVYLQLHAYMLRVAIPYGQLNARRMRRLADIADRYDKGYGHFTTRQNIQYNWVSLSDIPDVLEDLAEVEMHAIQTSGNCIRNVTSDHLAGAAADETDDPRPWCEVIRQWSTFHPEFSFLPRKFKIAVTGAASDRAAIRVHDIGLVLKRDHQGRGGFEVAVGGGQGRTPAIAVTIRDFLPKDDLLGYLEAILRVYNRFGRRDNKYKARIKILVADLGPASFRDLVEAEFAQQREQERPSLPGEELERIAAYFRPPRLESAAPESSRVAARRASDPDFSRWCANNLRPHKVSGHECVHIPLKSAGVPPGDATSAQMRAIADIAERLGHDDIRVAHEQDIVLPHVRTDRLVDVYDALAAVGLASASAGLLTDMIACPGLDYCNLANARSISVAAALHAAFSDASLEDTVGPLHINISGCINACGHHHVGHIGILGVDKKGEEFYQITFGGRADEHARIGDIAGPALRHDEVAPALRRVIDRYLDLRISDRERFIETVQRLGSQPFAEALYAAS